MSIKEANLPVANAVYRIIEEKGYKQRVVAEKAGLDPKSFSAMLTGRKVIQAAHICPIAEALGVPPSDLFRPSA